MSQPSNNTTCPRCGGARTIVIGVDPPRHTDCPTCHGTGRIEASKPDEHQAVNRKDGSIRCTCGKFFETHEGLALHLANPSPDKEIEHIWQFIGKQLGFLEFVCWCGATRSVRPTYDKQHPSDHINGAKNNE